jgi:hypothetical protein
LDRLHALSRLAQRAGPYLLLEMLLPGGTLIALLLYLHQNGHLRFLGGARRFAGDIGRRIGNDLERTSLAWESAPAWPVTMNH